MDKERLQRALDSLLYLPHLKDRAPQQAAPGDGGGGGVDAGGRGRVWDRGDFLRRLQTYKPPTWFCKPAAISAVECARRGWINSAPDLLTCEFCKAKLSCPIPAELLPEAAAEAAAQYSQQLREAHDTACPWRSSCCAASLLQFPPLTQEGVREDFHRRAASLQRLAALPPVLREAYERLAAGAHRTALDQLLLHGPGVEVPRQPLLQQGPGGGAAPGGQGGGSIDADSGEVAERLCEGGSAAWNADAYEPRLRLLALCGWDLQLLARGSVQAHGSSGPSTSAESGSIVHVGPECSMLVCALCGAKAGLWTFFPLCQPRVQAAGVRSRRPVSTETRAGPRASVTIAGGSLSGSGAFLRGPFGASSSAEAPLFGAPAALADSSDSPAPGQSLDAASALGGAGSRQDAARVGPAGQPDADALLCTTQAAGPAPMSWLPGSQGMPPEQPPAAAAAAAPGGTGALGKRLLAGELAAGRDTAAAQQQQQEEKRSRVGVGAAYESAGWAAATGAPPLDPLALHRHFCPWVDQQAGAQEAQQATRCGWRWCLQQLMPGADESTAFLSSALGAAEEGKQWDSAKLMAAVLRGVNVQS